MDYDYRKGKERVDEILNNAITITKDNGIPKDDKFTFKNGYYDWVTAIFIDIRDSSPLFSKKGLNDKKKTAKLIRAFTSEIIEILRDSDDLKEIGIRGDCVYAIYYTSTKDKELECANKTFYINTYLNMLNKLLEEKDQPTFKAGIGMATDQELVIKAGRNRSGINSKVWIGNAVTRASNLSGHGEKIFSGNRLVYSSTSYNNFIEGLKKRNSSENVENWFTKYTDSDGEVCYYADIIKKDFNNWIKNGMKDE